MTGAQAYKRLLKYTARFWLFFVIGTLGFLFNGLTEAASAKLVQYIIDHATSIFNVEDAMRKHIIVHKLQVLFGPDLLKRLT